MSLTEFQLADRIQFDIGRLEDEVKKLSIRLAALEAGAPLPANQKIEVRQPELMPLPTVTEPTPLQPERLPEIELGFGAALTISPLARPAQKRW